MSVPHAVVLHISEKNSSVDELNNLIQILVDENNFRVLGGPSYSSDKIHRGTTLVKSVSGDNPHDILENVQIELKNINTDDMAQFGCRLTVASTEVATDPVFIK